MSNVIKASNVRYEDTKKEIDFNERADIIVKQFFGTKLKAGNFSDDTGEDGFHAGLGHLPVIDEVDGEAEEVQQENEAEQRKRENEEYLQQQEEMRKRLEKDAAKILNDAKEEVKRILAEATVGAEHERKRIYEEARTQGYADGSEAARQEFYDLKKKMQEELDTKKRDYEKQVKELEPAFVRLVTELVKKMTGELVDNKKEIILYIIHQAMLGQSSSLSFIIRTSQQDYPVVRDNKDRLLDGMKDGSTIEVVEDMVLRKGQCMIETDSRIIDCSLDGQMKELLSDLRLLSGQ